MPCARMRFLSSAFQPPIPPGKQSLVIGLAFSLLLTSASSVLAWAPPTNINNATKGYWKGSFQWHYDATAVHMMLMRGATTHSQILFYYGGGPGGNNQPRVWLFDPDSSLFAVAASPITTPSSTVPSYLPLRESDSNFFCGGHAGLPDGRMLLTGGTEPNRGEGNGTYSTEIFDPSRTSEPYFSTVTPMNINRWYPTTTTLPNGTMLTSSGRRFRELVAFGGRDASSPKNTLAARVGLGLDPVKESTTINSTPIGHRSGHVAVFDHYNITNQNEHGYKDKQRMMVYGGDSLGTAFGDFWALTRTQSSSWKWTVVVPDSDATYGRPGARTRHAAAYDSLQYMYIVGGARTSGTLLKDVWKLQLRADSTGHDILSRITWGTGMTNARKEHSLVYQKCSTEKRLIVFGGINGTTYYRDVHKLLVGVDTTWTSVTPDSDATYGFPAARSGHVAVLDFQSSPNRMIVFGGHNGSTFYNDVWALNLPKTGAGSFSWHKIVPSGGSTPAARYFAAGVFDQEFRRLIIMGGGTDTNPANGNQKDDVWSLPLDTASPTWAQHISSLGTGAREGLTAVHDNRWVDADTVEVYTPASDTWQRLQASEFMNLYPHMYVLPNGTLFYADPIEPYTFDLSNSTWADGPASSFRGGSSVMYEPGKVMKCGTEDGVGTDSTSWIDMTAGTPSWHSTGSMSSPRVKHNLVLLPNGKVLVTGGLTSESGSHSTTKVTAPQIWDPVEHDWESTALADEPAIREYHSTAMLLPDGRILCGGGFSEDDRKKGTIYWPPYLFNSSGALATKPVIDRASCTIGYGGKFYVKTTHPDSISKVTLLRPGAVTHQFNQNQRFLNCSYTQVGTSTTLSIDAPSDSNVAPPGDYMLFILDNHGVPSIAQWVRVKGEGYQNPSTIVSGTVSTATWSGRYLVADNLTVGSSATLTLSANAVVEVAGGATTTITVAGTLTGTAGGANFKVYGCDTKWGGLRIEQPGTANLTSATIRDADYGIKFEGGSGSPGSSTLTGCTFSNNTTGNLKINNTGVAVTATSCTFNCTSTTNHIGVAIGSSAGTTTVERCVINGTSASGSKGIYCQAGATLTGNKVYNFSNSTGIGIQFDLSDTTIVPIVDSYTTGDTAYTIVKNCREGIVVSNYARPQVHNSRIHGNVNAVRVDPAAYIDMGSNISGSGNNDVSRGSGKLVSAQSHIAGWPIPDAVANWWGTSNLTTIAAQMSTAVNWTAMGSDLYGFMSAPGVQLQTLPGVPHVLGNAPNPFRDSTRILFHVGEAGLPVSVKVFDVSGHCVRSFQLSSDGSGDQQVPWDGHNSTGGRVSAGMYFYKVWIGDRSMPTQRMLLVR